jgi:hypothetical protein
VLLNLCCAFVRDFDSMLRAEMLKILLQQYLPEADLRSAANTHDVQAYRGPPHRAARFLGAPPPSSVMDSLDGTAGRGAERDRRALRRPPLTWFAFTQPAHGYAEAVGAPKARVTIPCRSPRRGPNRRATDQRSIILRGLRLPSRAGVGAGPASPVLTRGRFVT